MHDVAGMGARARRALAAGAWAVAVAAGLAACGGSGVSSGACIDGDPCGVAGVCIEGKCFENVDGGNLPDIPGDAGGDTGAPDTAGDTGAADTAPDTAPDTAVEDLGPDTAGGDTAVEDTGEPDAVEDAAADGAEDAAADVEIVEGECGNGLVEGLEGCDDGNTDDEDACHNDCTPACGDGVLADFEACDVAIEAGEVGACPTECPLDAVEDACQVASLEGEACDAVCVYGPVTACVGGDGCCGFGCDAVADPDCPPECGNGVVEPGETCDPKGTCPTECDDGNACTVDVLVGSVDACTADCDAEPVTVCETGDACCPPGCKAEGDGDCSDECGDGFLDPGETCDPPESCPTDCADDDPCTEDLLTGSAGDCNVACSNPPITAAADGDGCCPEGANANTDGDCSPECGNLVPEPGEACDPCEACPADDACTTWTSSGSAGGCDLVCTPTTVEACGPADGCCPGGCSAAEDEDCVQVCGNGKLEPGETCDPPGTCPTACDDEDPCTTDALEGSAALCTAVCVATPVTTPQGGDGCCPEGANANNDGDCEPQCGNGVVEGGELCDPCPTACDDGDACTADALEGSGCAAFCATTPVTACGEAEGCCPGGCDAAQDADCEPVCGNGVLEPGETCDPCPGSCADGDPCTKDVATGSAGACTLVCTHPPVTDPVGGDGCCPAGANANNDADCEPDCGNGVLEPGEGCDPCDPCPPSAGCAVVTPAGSAATCDLTCEETEVTACAGGDGCCPADCDANSDGDCSATCGNGSIEPGETCDPPGDCPASCDDGKACTADKLVGSAANCNAACTFTAITTPKGGDGCCPPGANANNDTDCAPVCGNKVKEPGEACDPCPTACDDGDACTADALEGTGCQAVCVAPPITAPVDGDGCCPPGADANTDGDCDPVCPNGVIEPGETCDPCPAGCADGDPCTKDVATGSAEACTLACDNVPITAPVGGDGCCPPGANANNDGDCEPDCGNGVQEPGETCDPCPAGCDDGNPCTADQASGAAGTCDLVCTATPITLPANGDGCCPGGANANDDDDCEPFCGNAVKEAGETCDPCPPASSCVDDDPCTEDGATGAPGTCDLVCVNAPITAAADGDGCCPAGQDATTDGDCEPVCGNGVPEPGETCDPCPPVTACSDGDACTADVATGDPDLCVVGCEYPPITACANGDGCCPGGCTALEDDDCEAAIDPGSSVTTTSACLTKGAQGEATVVVTLVDTVGGAVSGATVSMTATAGTLSAVSADGNTYWAVLKAGAGAPASGTVTVVADGVTLTAKPTVTFAAPLTDLGGGAGGCPADGNLRVRVVDTAGTPLAGAYVMVGDAPAAVLQPTLDAAATGPTTATTNANGYAFFRDVGAFLDGAVTVTAAAADRQYLTFAEIDASDFVMPLAPVYPAVQTGKLSGDVTSIPTNTGDPIETAIVFPDLQVETLANFNLNALLADSECYDIGGFAGQQGIPGNVYIPSQCAAGFGSFCLQTLPKHAFTTAPLPFGTRKMVALRGGAPLNALLSGGITGALGSLTLNGIGVVDKTITSAGTTTQNIGISQTLSTTAACSIQAAPANSDVFCVTAGDWDSGASEAVLPGEGRLMVSGFKVGDAAGKTGAWTIGSVPFAPKAGDFAAIEYVGAAVALYLDSAKAGIPAGTADGTSAILDRSGSPFATSGGTMTFDDFLPIRTVGRSGRDYTVGALPAAGTFPTPGFVKAIVQQRVIEAYSACEANDSTRSTTYTLWEVYAPGASTGWTLPLPPADWPRAASQDQYAGLVTPSATPETDLVNWKAITVHEGLNPTFAYDALRLTGFRRFVTHVSSNIQNF